MSDKNRCWQWQKWNIYEFLTTFVSVSKWRNWESNFKAFHLWNALTRRRKPFFKQSLIIVVNLRTKRFSVVQPVINQTLGSPSDCNVPLLNRGVPIIRKPSRTKLIFMYRLTIESRDFIHLIKLVFMKYLRNEINSTKNRNYQLNASDKVSLVKSIKC